MRGFLKIIKNFKIYISKIKINPQIWKLNKNITVKQLKNKNIKTKAKNNNKKIKNHLNEIILNIIF